MYECTGSSCNVCRYCSTMAEGDGMSCSGECCTYDSSEENRHVSLQGRVGGEGSWQTPCDTGNHAVRGVEVGNSCFVLSPHHTHTPQEHGVSPSSIPAAQRCTRRLPNSSNWPAVLIVSTVLLLLLHPTLLAASQVLSSPTVLYGLPDVVTAVGQSFSLAIPEDAFSGHVVTFEVCCHGDE